MAEPIELHLFERIGVELEYMIVDAGSLDVLPVCDRVMQAETGEITAEVAYDDIAWNNELVLHVIELKTRAPVPTLDGLDTAFERHVARVHEHLQRMGGRLMPTAMHPWMDPHTATRLWPHEASTIYDTFHRIFDCRGHGWSNLQSLHINLPFVGDEEFGRLHAAIRLLLPIMPAVAASSPIMDAWATGVLDNRLAVYGHNCDRVPIVTGQVIPEPIFTIEGYQGLLQTIFETMRPHDPEGILAHEWVNARGAIARLDRGSIEIRVLDMQECPAADLAIVALIVNVLKLLVAETWSDLAAQQAWPVEPLAAIYEAAIRDGELTVIDDQDYLRIFGWSGGGPCTAGRLWRHLADSAVRHAPSRPAPFASALDTILTKGPLARRILANLPDEPARADIERTYRRLCKCLDSGTMFEPDDRT